MGRGRHEWSKEKHIIGNLEILVGFQERRLGGGRTFSIEGKGKRVWGEINT